jgi:hypothetical protein
MTAVKHSPLLRILSVAKFGVVSSPRQIADGVQPLGLNTTGALTKRLFPLRALGLIPLVWAWRDRSRRSRLAQAVNLDLPEVPDNLTIFRDFPAANQYLFGRQVHIGQLGASVES